MEGCLLNKAKSKTLSDVQAIAQAISDKKGENIIIIDVREVCSFTDYFIFAEGTVPRHVCALADHVEKSLKELGRTPSHKEGMQEGDWVVLDFLDIIVHILTPEMRAFYALEEVWNKGKIVSIDIT